jgi:hypothetical protein
MIIYENTFVFFKNKIQNSIAVALYKAPSSLFGENRITNIYSR